MKDSMHKNQQQIAPILCNGKIPVRLIVDQFMHNTKRRKGKNALIEQESFSSEKTMGGKRSDLYNYKLGANDMPNAISVT